MFSLAGCKEDVGVLDTAEGSLREDYTLVFTDTATVKASTVLLDSFPTSGGDYLLVGKYNDDKLGVVESEAYFQISMGSSAYWKPSPNIHFDSMVLTMYRANYYQGDTTMEQTFEVREIDEQFQSYSIDRFWVDQNHYSYLTANNFAFYNTSTLGVKSGTPLGSFKLKRRRSKMDSVTVRLDQSVGEKWLQEALKLTGSPFNSNNDFLKFFKGISIRNVSGGGSVIGLLRHEVSDDKNNQNNDKILIRYYYHEFNEGLKVAKRVDFVSLKDVDIKFNHITADRSSLTSGLKNLSAATNEIPSEQTSGETYVQSGVGVVTKVYFPHLKELLNLPNLLQVTDAKLVFRPIAKTFNSIHPLPSQMVLFTTDRSNFPRGLVGADYSGANSVQIASITVDNESETTSGYSFSITQYVKAFLNSNGGDSRDRAFMLSTPIVDLEGTTNRVIIGGGSHPRYNVQLEIHYLKRNE